VQAGETQAGGRNQAGRQAGVSPAESRWRQAEQNLNGRIQLQAEHGRRREQVRGGGR